jgi:rod shape-determining protein MreB
MDFAILLGMGRTVIYKRNEGVVLNEATKIATRMGGKRVNKVVVVAAGDAAKRMQDKVDNYISIHSPIEDGRVVDTEMAKLLLLSFLKRVNPNGSIASVSCLFLIPCSLSPLELDEYRAVAYGAGIEHVEFIPSIVASAYALGYDPNSSAVALSINIGEGGTDIAAICMGSILAGGSLEGGGSAATRAIIDYIERKHKIAVSERMAELAKIETATLLLHDEVSFKVIGTTDCDETTTKTVDFTGIDCYKILFPIYSRITKAALQVINECKPDAIADIKDGNVFVAGGGSSPTGLREFMTTNLDIPVVLNRDSVNAVIIGAGRLLNDEKLLKTIIAAN